MQIHDRFQSPEFAKNLGDLIFNWKWSDFDDYMSRYGTKNPDEMTKFTMFFTYWEGLAVIVRRGLMSVELIYDLNYNAVIAIWERYAPVVAGMRRLGNSPQLYEPVEWMYGEMKRLQATKGHSYTLPK